MELDVVDDVQRDRFPRNLLRTRDPLGQTPSPVTVDVDHRERTTVGCEQACFRLEVLLDRVVEVEVVATQVREHADAEPCAVDAVLCECV